MGKCSLIVTTDKVEEKVFFEELAHRNSMPFITVGELSEFRDALKSDPSSLVVWDIDRYVNDPALLQSWSVFLKERCPPETVFALCADPATAYSQAFNEELPFQHVIRRRFGSNSLEILAHLLDAAMEEYPLGLERYFAPGAFSQSIKLKKSEHRRAASDAMQSFLTKSGAKPRIAAIAAQAVDELLMNAIFNAPHDVNGSATRRNLSRGAHFDLHRNEYVDMEIMVSDQYYGIRVTDLFGTFSRDTMIRVLSRDYRNDAYSPKVSQVGAGLGLRGILGLGLSLLFSCKPEARTDAIIFWPVAKSHVEFKKGFQFVAYFGRPSSNRRFHLDDSRS